MLNHHVVPLTELPRGAFPGGVMSELQSEAGPQMR